MKSSKAIINLFIVQVVLLSGCTFSHLTLERKHQDYYSLINQSKSIMILTPNVTVSEIFYDGTSKEMLDEEATVSEEISTKTKRLLERYGYNCKINSDVNFKSNRELQFDISKLKMTIDNTLPELYGKAVKSQDKAKFHASVGPIASVVASQTNADALLLIYYSAYHRSAGLQAKDFFADLLYAIITLGGSNLTAPSGARAFAILVDGASGSILWTNIRQKAGAGSHVALAALSQLPHAKPPKPGL